MKKPDCAADHLGDWPKGASLPDPAGVKERDSSGTVE